MTWNGCSASLRVIKEPTLLQSTHKVTSVDLGEIFDDTQSFPAMRRQFTENWNENFPIFHIAQHRWISQSQNPMQHTRPLHFDIATVVVDSIQPAIKNNKNTSVRAVSRATRAHIHPPRCLIYDGKKRRAVERTRGAAEQKEEENKLRKKIVYIFFYDRPRWRRWGRRRPWARGERAKEKSTKKMRSGGERRRRTEAKEGMDGTARRERKYMYRSGRQRWLS